ncbi:response regulator [Chloroflexota bacterium]
MARKKILVADDEPNIRKLLKRMLGKTCVVLEASDGEEAVNIALTEKPDVILMDILMPNMDGYTAYHKLKKNGATRTIPIVMLTGMAFQPHRKLAKKMGVDGYITKPFNPKVVADKIEQYQPVATPGCLLD